MFDRKHKSLKMQIFTRWNSALYMLDSIKQMLDPVQNLLKQIGKRELCFDSDEQDLLQELVLFLKPFDALTKVVSGSCSNSVAILPLIKHKIEKLLLISASDSGVIKQLKTSCGAKLDTRLQMSDTATLACMLDPGVKVMFSNDDLLDQLLKAVGIGNRSNSQPLRNGMLMV